MSVAARRGGEVWVTPLDARLLAAIDRTGNLVKACASLRIGRDRGGYRLRRLAAAAGSPVVRTTKGGPKGGGTVLTPVGQRLAQQGMGPVSPGSGTRGVHPEGPSHLRGRWHARPHPHVVVDGGPRLWVSFRATEGERVGLVLNPESVLLARHALATSARNVLLGRVREVRRGTGEEVSVEAEVGRSRIRARVTPQARTELSLRPGSRVYLYVKATALRPEP